MPTKAEIEQWLVAKIVEKTGISEVTVDKEFTSFGLDSAQSIIITGELERWSGIECSPTLLYNYPNIESLAAFLDPKNEVNLKNFTSQQNYQNMDEIAIVGLDCRFPGASSKEEFWDNLIKGIDSIEEIPKERWDVEKYYDSRKGIKGKMYTKWGGFIKDVRGFDNHFFNLQSREVEKMDPQQRLLMEVSWGALEDAGIIPSSLKETNTGVFIGISSNDYARLQYDKESIDAFTATGSSQSIAANRLSYFYKINGPSVAIDTACSSSLVAIHQACQSLRLGECDIAIVGGVNLILSPDLNIAFSQSHMMAPDGKCKTFDEGADGYVRGEGCGVIILKRLSDVELNKERSYAVINGSAVNQDGGSNGLTAPNGNAQEAVIRRALLTASMEPQDISYIEAHGTGTSLGDPIEMNTLVAIYGKETVRKDPCFVGSVKTNIGHLEGAAGIASIIKTTLMLHYKKIVPHLHFQKPNRLITLNDSFITIPLQSNNWNSEKTRAAGVSSFGFGGTNAHIILSETQSVDMKKSLYDQDVQVFTLSAKSPKSLKQLANKYKNFLDVNSDVSLKDLCYTVNCHREHFHVRVAFSVTSIQQLKEKLQAYYDKDELGKPRAEIEKKQQTQTKTVFLYSGQGAQYKQMGQTLYRSSPVFKHALIRCAKILQKYNGMRLLDILFDKKEDSQINQTEFTQPVLFAIQYSLTQLWKSFGVIPDIVLGHSIGEYAAACEAGVLSLEDALCLVAERGQCMQASSSNGTMAIIRTEEGRVKKYLQQHSFEDVTIAAINAPDRLVISGEKSHVEKIVQFSQNEGVLTSYLNVSRAFHSPLMDPILDHFARQAEKFTYESPQITFISNLTGRPFQNVPSSKYWVQHLREAVRFKDGVEYVLQEPCVWIEMGPISLLSLVRRLDKDNSQLLLASLDSKKHEDWNVITDSLSKLYEAGRNINWEIFHAPYDHHFTDLPTYAFEKNPHWIKNSVDRIELLEENDLSDLLKQQAATLENQSHILQRYSKTLIK